MPQLRNKTLGAYATGGENYSNTCEAMSSNKKNDTWMHMKMYEQRKIIPPGQHSNILRWYNM